VNDHDKATKEEAEAAVITLLRYLGEDPDRDGLLDTPARVVKALKEMTVGYSQKPKEILSKQFKASYDEMVIVRGIEFWSMCEHHMLPFHGKAVVCYIPDPEIGKVVGLSKLARLVHCFGRRLQIQEQMTQQIATAINENLKPRGVGVILEAKHLCMCARGVSSPSTMVTSCVLGVLRDKPEARAEFLQLAMNRG